MKWVLHLKEVRGKRYGRWWQVRKLWSNEYYLFVLDVADLARNPVVVRQLSEDLVLDTELLHHQALLVHLEARLTQLQLDDVVQALVALPIIGRSQAGLRGYSGSVRSFLGISICRWRFTIFGLGGIWVLIRAAGQWFLESISLKASWARIHTHSKQNPRYCWDLGYSIRWR
jgi:hypothetical protein